MHRFLKPVMCAAILLTIGLQSPVRADEKAVTFARPFKVGDAVKYKSTATIDLGGQKIVVTQNRKHVVKLIKDNGEIVIDIVDEGGKVDLGGSEMDIPAKSPETITSDKQGKMLAYKPSAEENPYLSNTTLHLLAVVDRIVLTDKEVKAGDSWTTEIDNPAAKGKKVAIKTTYVGTEKVGGADAWKVKQTVDADTDGGKLNADVTALLDPANGQIISADQTLKGIPGQMGAIDWTSKLVRVKGEEKKAEK